MVRLIASAPFDGLLPIEGAGLRVEAHDPGAMVLLHGAEMAPDTADVTETGLRIWMGPGQVMVMGDAPGAEPGVTQVDQSDAWAVARVIGESGPDMLARLVPVDLRPGVFGAGRTARTLIGHMAASVTRLDEETLEIMVMRSMAGSLVHDLSRALSTLPR